MTNDANRWIDSGRHALVSGTLASVLSTGVLAWLGKRRLDKPFAPTNATSHWLWGDAESFNALNPTLRHTAVGYATHHASACMWAFIYHRWLASERDRAPATILRDAALITAASACIDYGLIPKRLSPGFEAHLSRSDMLGVFATIAAGLALGALLTTTSPSATDRTDTRRSQS